MQRRYLKRHPVTGLIVGAISGLAGTVVMTQFQNVWNKVSEEMQKPKAQEEAKRAQEKKKAPKEDSTMKAAGRISKEIGRPLSREERKKAGPWVHYAFGTSVGAVFGVATEMKPEGVRRLNPLLTGGGLRRRRFCGCTRNYRARTEAFFESTQGTDPGTDRRICVALNLWRGNGAYLQQYQGT